MKNKYFKYMFDNLSKGLERRTIIENDNLGVEALYDMQGNFLISTNKDVQVSDKPYLSEVLSGKLELVVCGGGHVGLAVYKLGIFLGWNVSIVEDRMEYCTEQMYPEATRLVGKYSEILSGLELSHAAIVVATRGHKFDKSCVAALLPKQYKYLGMIGSKSKVSKTMELLGDDIKNNIIDCNIEKLSEINSPIGLEIKAQTPEEIAVSIIAEIIKITKADKKQIQMKVNDIENLSNTEKPFVVARIIEKQGSAPREVGSFLAVLSDGTLIGTVGGGAVEALVINDCKKLLNDSNNQSAICHHDLSNESASNLGMICGGNVKLILNKFTS
jgi:xanthine dehydrogenase accessory factor